ncbi:hypothetical protein A3770_08p52880 [Chloropicon primus]|uniref:Uncharacterized protein n=1 Tax=Chloropicon primus TaxID=1764295 RepID=A0A5B8MTL4_9CHLO|nr:hypothetical protein A3770_08p52880 [Chloropicon primus]|eukprot:QDZ22770.1 hypothetical protein A3770_08p52880 [Chloropicon primus]
MAKMAPSSKYDKMNKPFAATDPSKVPTIGEQWAYAARRYSKYQGYAWSGVLCVAGIAFLGSMVTSPKEEEERKVEEGKRT